MLIIRVTCVSITFKSLDSVLDENLKPNVVMNIEVSRGGQVSVVYW